TDRRRELVVGLRGAAVPRRDADSQVARPPLAYGGGGRRRGCDCGSGDAARRDDRARHGRRCHRRRRDREEHAVSSMIVLVVAARTKRVPLVVAIGMATLWTLWALGV